MYFACGGNEALKRKVEKYGVYDYYKFMLNARDWAEANKPPPEKKRK